MRIRCRLRRSSVVSHPQGHALPSRRRGVAEVAGLSCLNPGLQAPRSCTPSAGRRELCKLSGILRTVAAESQSGLPSPPLQQSLAPRGQAPLGLKLLPVATCSQTPREQAVLKASRCAQPEPQENGCPGPQKMVGQSQRHRQAGDPGPECPLQSTSLGAPKSKADGS